MTQKATDHVLEVNNIEVIYNKVVQALRGLSLAVPRGQIVALLGSNGAGKSTTLKAVSGLLALEDGQLESGSILFNGQSTAALAPQQLVRSGLSHVMEGRRVFEDLTVEENLVAATYALTGRKEAPKPDFDIVYSYFPRLHERRKGLAGYLSGGEQQMLAIGRALIAQPQLILLDEPSLGLSPKLVEDIFTIIARINAERGTSMLLVALLGAQSAGPAIFVVLIDMVFTSSVCIALSRLDGAGAQGVGAAVRNALKGIATNPMPWSIALGAVASALQFQLPGPVDKTVAMLADAASPVALFTIGAVLARSQMNQHEQVLARDYVPVALAKLLVHPLLVWCVGTAAIALGVPLSPFALTVLVLVAALPSASNVSLLAERFGANNGRVARIILVSTALAFLSFSAAVALLT